MIHDQRRVTNGSVERVSASAGATGVGVVDGEPLLLDAVDEVDGRAAEIGRAHPIDHDVDPAEALADVAVARSRVEEELVPQTGTAARLHDDAQLEVVTALLVEQALDLDRCPLGEDDAIGRLFLNRHRCSPDECRLRPGAYNARPANIIPRSLCPWLHTFAAAPSRLGSCAGLSG